MQSIFGRKREGEAFFLQFFHPPHSTPPQLKKEKFISSNSGCVRTKKPPFFLFIYTFSPFFLFLLLVQYTRPPLSDIWERRRRRRKKTQKPVTLEGGLEISLAKEVGFCVGMGGMLFLKMWSTFTKRKTFSSASPLNSTLRDLQLPFGIKEGGGEKNQF